ncbi:MAG: DUF192 domain-containing protein [Candidatus Levybacteria bacterium]|nr:DUF192 domain-containing protein [Candidatus Levybacteria bacterium]
MKKVLLAFVLLLVVAIGVLFMQKYLKTKTFSLFNKNSTATINNHTFKLIIASSQKEREVGLSETKSLPQDQGMIFLFEKPDYYSFWMKNMTFPIDIIYINKDEIVTIQSNVQPPKNSESPVIYTSEKPSDKVLEITSGLSEKYSFKKGDKVKYENLSN